MKIAVISANTGGIDDKRGIPLQNLEVDYYCAFDNTLPFPLPNLDARMRARYIKTQMHRYMPGYDFYIWIDAGVEILSKDFSKMFTDALDEHDCVIFKHWERDTIYNELDFIAVKIKQGNHYLLSRYGDQMMEAERKLFKKAGLPKDTPLYATTLYGIRNNKKVNAAWDEWWKRILEFSCFDQAMFSYIAKQFELKVNALDSKDYVKVFTRHKHIKK